MPHPASEHFKGKSIPEHLKEARMKGAQASAEIHGTEIAGHAAAFADSLRDTALVLALSSEIAFAFLPKNQAILFVLLLVAGWTIWKACRSALLAWARLERLHRLIEEERWEIEHHRPQEREELMDLYEAKGFEGELLTEVLDVLMADENRLLQVMLTEELGLSLESYEHPLKQAFGALLGAGSVLLVGALSFFFLPLNCLYYIAGALFLGASLRTAKIENIKLLPSLIWNLAVFALTLGFVHFAGEFFRK
jgi:hypothetical protein